MQVGAGVTQSSVHRLTRWNAFYDGMFCLAYHRRMRMVRYAEDLTVDVTGRSVEEVGTSTNEALEVIGVWMIYVFQLALQKTKDIIFDRRRNRIRRTYK